MNVCGIDMKTLWELKDETSKSMKLYIETGEKSYLKRAISIMKEREERLKPRNFEKWKEDKQLEN